MKKTKRFIGFLLVLQMMLMCTLIPGVTATDVVTETPVESENAETVLAVLEATETEISVEDLAQDELMPMAANDCEEDIDYDYYSQYYPISATLHGCSGYVSSFSASGAAFYTAMTNYGLELYFQSVSPGTWKKGYQNGYYDGVECSIHFFKNTTTGSAYSGYKLVEGWVN